MQLMYGPIGAFSIVYEDSTWSIYFNDNIADYDLIVMDITVQ